MTPPRREFKNEADKLRYTCSGLHGEAGGSKTMVMIASALQKAYEEGQRKSSESIITFADFCDQTKRFQLDPDDLRELAKRLLPIEEK